MKKEVHNYDKIVLGATLEGLVYAYLHGLPVFYSIPKKPIEFETLEPDSFRWDFINHQNVTSIIKTPEKEFLVGSSKELVWNKLAFMLSFQGLMPCTNPQSVRIDEDCIKITTENNKLIRIKPKEILLFDDEGIDGLGIPYKSYEERIVYDWVSFSNFSSNVNFNLITTEYDFCNKIWFLPAADKRAKYDGCLVSYCSNMAEVENELTDYTLRFTLRNVFKNYNIKGCFNGIDNRYGTAKQKYLSVKTKFIHRDIVKTKPNLYHDYDNIKSMTDLTLKDILEKLDYTNYVLFTKCLKLTKKTDQQNKIFTLLE